MTCRLCGQRHCESDCPTARQALAALEKQRALVLEAICKPEREILTIKQIAEEVGANRWGEIALSLTIGEIRNFDPQAIPQSEPGDPDEEITLDEFFIRYGLQDQPQEDQEDQPQEDQGEEISETPQELITRPVKRPRDYVGEVRSLLEKAKEPLFADKIRILLMANSLAITKALRELEIKGLIIRTKEGWIWCSEPLNGKAVVPKQGRYLDWENMLRVTRALLQLRPFQSGELAEELGCRAFPAVVCNAWLKKAWRQSRGKGVQHAITG